MFDRKIYISRRDKLVSSMKSGLILLLGNSEASCNYADNQYLFRQDSSFLYFFGLDKPDLAAIIDVESGKQIVFGNDVDIDDIIWMGPQPYLRDQAAEIGVNETYPFAKLADFLAEAQNKGRKIHFLPPYRNHNKILLNKLLGVAFDQMTSASSLELINAVVKLRIIKEPCEIEEIDKACNVGYTMHYTAMKMMKPGMVEQQIVGMMEGVCASDALMPSFPIILSQNGETLHNHTHHQILTEGRLCVVDAGAEIASHYASDFTRTLPCSGKFTTMQKEIYTIVSTANNLALDMARPGITYKEVHLSASKIIVQGLINLGLVKGDVEEAVAAGVQGLFMPHGLGHNMGLDVHDMEDLGENNVGYDEAHVRATQFGLASLRMARELQPGHVITDEPGIYFIPALIEKWKKEGTCRGFINFAKLESYYKFGGVRIEDDLLITKNGCRLLGAKRLPNTVEDVEEQMRG